MPSKLVGRIWVGFTTSLIAFISYSSQIFIIWPWYGRELSVELVLLLAPFNLLVGMLYWNYFLCVRTPPGQVPRSWRPNPQSNEDYEVKRLTGSPRYCRNCESYKPPRAHHCKQCQKCVLRMDHHCPWVNNCIGHYNYGSFLRFLFFVDVACSYHLTMVTRRVMDSFGPTGYMRDPSTAEILLVIFNYAACIPVILAVGCFSIYHFYCLCTNTTTIEGWEKDKVAMLIRRGKIREIKFPYNIGVLPNIRSVLGNNPLLWCWPQSMHGSGLSFQVADGADPDIQNIWPPKDPASQSERSGPPPQLSLGSSSAFTYGNNSFNPLLNPTNTATLRARKNNHTTDGISSVPPYHPAYDQGGQDDEAPSSSEGGSNPSPNTPRTSNGHKRVRREEKTLYPSITPSHETGNNYLESSDSDSQGGDQEPFFNPRRIHRRRGSEGWEIRPMSKDEIIQRYIRSRRLETSTGDEGANAADTMEGDLEDADDARGRQGNTMHMDLPPDHHLDRPDRYRRYIPDPPSDDGLDDSDGSF